LLALVIGFACGLTALAGSLAAHGAKWAGSRANAHVFSNGQLVSAGGIYDRNGVALAASAGGERILPESKTTRMATLHAVGDPQGFISAGVQSVFRAKLIGWSAWNGMYPLVRYGRGSDVLLNLDAELCATAYKALNGHKGTVAVMDYRTGELLCMVSAPSFDPLHKPENMEGDEKYDAIYMNRFLHGLFTPGSVFKIVTAAAAIENIPDIHTQVFTCTGKYATGEGYVICSGTHGKIHFEQAMNNSCNAAFAAIAEQLGEQKLRAMAEQLGFSRQYAIDGIPLSPSRFSGGGMNVLELGWAGIGQHTTLANPAHFLMLMSAVANGGEGAVPRLVAGIRSPGGFVAAYGRKESGVRLSAATARQLVELLRSNVQNKYDSDGSEDAMQLCGKTGTAEVNGKKPHAWFAGFSANPQTPYSIVIVAENGGSGQGVAYDIAAKVMRAVCG
jgi:peptidoglycan glycosyltransferase